tara:strand:+ start:5405 stop:6124 length:720 start_codon:yes stop_codon:yes gene_type:complete
MNYLNEFYDDTSKRFWNPADGPIGRDLQVLPLVKGEGSFLEYGFGSGSLLFQVAKDKKFNNVVGVDLSKMVIQRAKDNLKIINKEYCKKLKFIQPDLSGEKLPDIKDESFDFLVSVATIEHVLNPYTVLDELYRIAKSNSYLICSVPNYAYIKYRLQLLFGVLPITGTDKPIDQWREAGWDGMHIHCFTKKAFSILLNDCGWEVISFYGWGKKFPLIGPLRKKFPSILSGELIAYCKKK